MDIREVEQYLCQIRSVRSCKIQQDEEGNIQEIHIVADLSRNSKQISRDIQSILISKFDLNIDYKMISIAQIKQDLFDGSGFRLKLSTLEYSTVVKKSEIKVVLEKDEEFFEGTASGPNTSNNALRMLSLATLQAVENFIGIDQIFILDDIKPLSIAGKKVMISVVTSIFDGKEQMLSGSAIVEKDEKEAVVKATLDAVNRTVSKIPR